MASAAALAAAPPGVAPQSTTTCDDAINPELGMAPTATDRIVFNRAAFIGTGILQTWRVDNPPHFYGSKTGIMIRPRRTPVDVIVPAAWRSRVAIEWVGSQVASRIRFRGCSPVNRDNWLAFSGGIYVKSRACVPLVIRAGRQQALVRFPVGAPC